MANRPMSNRGGRGRRSSLERRNNTGSHFEVVSGGQDISRSTISNGGGRRHYTGATAADIRGRGFRVPEGVQDDIRLPCAAGRR